MREKIGKALKARSEAIRRALANYNELAQSLRPPREKLTWPDLMQMAALAKFDLLRNARQDVRTERWAQPAYREATRLHFNVRRAREEIVRMNVELRRVLTGMYDEHQDYYMAISKSIFMDPTLAFELSCRWQYSVEINSRIYSRLLQTASLSGFTGCLELGQRVGRAARDDGIPPPPWWVDFQVEAEDDEDDRAPLPSQENDFVDYLERLESEPISITAV